jgi:predicted nucleotidyltransferase
MAQTRDEIVVQLQKLFLELKRKHDIRAAYLFGSFARGSQRDYSDVDIAVVLGSFRNGSPFDERFEIFHEVQQHNALFEVVCVGEKEFEADEGMLIRLIKREGLRIL